MNAGITGEKLFSPPDRIGIAAGGTAAVTPPALRHPPAWPGKMQRPQRRGHGRGAPCFTGCRLLVTEGYRWEGRGQSRGPGAADEEAGALSRRKHTCPGTAATDTGRSACLFRLLVTRLRCSLFQGLLPSGEF